MASWSTRLGTMAAANNITTTTVRAVSSAQCSFIAQRRKLGQARKARSVQTVHACG